MRSAIIGVAAALMLGAGAAEASARPACAPAGQEKAVQAAVAAWFDANRHDDLAAVGKLQTADFYAFDAGDQFKGLALSQELKAMHAAGVQIVWNLHDVKVQAGCDLALASWVNTGSATRGGKTQDVTWLESAVLRWQGGAWRLAFLHSARVPPKAS